MSFSGNVKEELSHHLGSARHCRIAETAAIISICGGVMIDSRGRYSLKIHTENLSVARKCFTLLTKTFNISLFQQMATTGQFNADRLIWKNGMSEWVKEGTIDELK